MVEKVAAAPPKPIEEVALARLGVKPEVLTASSVLDEYFEKLSFRLGFLDTSFAVLQAFANIDVTSDKVALFLRGNPFLEETFLRIVQMLSKREELPPLESAVVLLGMQNSRNWIAACQLYRQVTGKQPEWDPKDGKIKLQPKDILKYALKVEESLASKKANFADLAFSAGMVFDALSLAAQEIGASDPKKVQAYADTLFTHSQRAAVIAVELAKGMPELAASKYVYAGALLHDIGKLAMAALLPDYFRFLDELGKKELPRTIRHYVETKRFGINHCELGALVLQGFKLFKPIERPVLFHHQSYVLRSSASAHAAKKLEYLTTSLLALATNMASSFKKFDNPNDPQINLWRGVELKDFKLDNRMIVQALSKIQF